MAYLYDVFISYPHQEHHQLWVRDIFLESFELYLTNEVGYPVRIFIDQEGVEAGDTWPLRLKRALAQSRILLPVWSVNYFHSDWCMAECAVLLHREEKLSYRTLQNPRGLIYPVKLFDGTNYPDFAQNIEPLDCTPFNIISPNYKTTPQYYELLKRVRDWIPQIAQAIKEAPEWREEFLSDAWLEEPVRQWIHKPGFQFPRKPFRAPSLALSIPAAS